MSSPGTERAWPGAGVIAPAAEPRVDSRPEPIAGRTPRELVWSRLRTDRVALAGGAAILVVILVAVFGPWLNDLLGNQPDTFHSQLIRGDTLMPTGRFGGASWSHPLGVEPVNGRDVLARLIAGARTSMLVSSAATVLSFTVGIAVGVLAGYRGGLIDQILSPAMDLVLSFPIMLFSLALLEIFGSSRDFLGMSGAVLNYVTLIFVLGFFSFPYVGRVVRGQVITLRDQEFVDAARLAGASTWRIMTREIAPNLVGPVVVLVTLTVPVFIMGEAGLSFLGIGLQPPTASWGQMQAVAGQWFVLDPTFLLWPGLTLFLVVLAFNLFGDGLSQALDPRSSR